ncbi:hypothetical protein [Rhodococcoides corynebacterioides]|uniref:hypothetical protein n=1 Tax=Rhodococcoides corynebacterioides TaxID=53972 RepID=UPI000829BA98|nr:hypothetical protein [Rhodococcus corynebacterioides]
MNQPGPVSEARAQFDAGIDQLAAVDPDAAVVVLTMARLAADAMRGENTQFVSAAARVVDSGRTSSPTRARSAATRTRSARTPAVLDPFDVFRSDGRDALRSRLAELSLDQLRDVIHQYGMDPDKRAMKWKTVSRLRDRILESTEATRNRDRAFH